MEEDIAIINENTRNEKIKNFFIKIAIDSPAAAGAGTVAKSISKHYNLLYVDTGKAYRMLAMEKLNNPKKFNLIFAKKKMKTLSIKDLDKKTTEVLSKFRYQKNTVFLHSDPSMMPRNHKTWSSWNYLSNKNGKSATTYWMNQLQDLNTSLNLLIL